MSIIHPLTEPPAAGFYWWRADNLDRWQVLEVREDRQRDGALYVIQDSAEVYQAADDPEHPWSGEWWPERLQTPPE